MLVVLCVTNGFLALLVAVLIWWNWKLVERFTNPPKSYLEEQLARMGRRGRTEDARVVAEGAASLASSPVDDADKDRYEQIDETL